MKSILSIHPLVWISSSLRILILTALVCFAFVLSPVVITNAATITVNSTSDVIDANDGLCTLREGITAANTDTASGIVFGECSPGSGADVINIPVGSYILTADQSITDDLTIYGSGASNTIIDRGWTTEISTMRIFSITHGTNVSINNITIKNGYAQDTENGAGIFNNGGNLNIRNCIFADNHASNSTNDLGRGGAIHNNGGNVYVAASTFTGNYAGQQGGAIGNENVGELTVVNSLFVNNQSAAGGGIANSTGSVAEISNSTFSSNISTNGGGIFNPSGTITITNCTFANNTATYGGGIYNSAIMNLSNTIIAYSQQGTDCYNDGGSINVNNFNIIEDDSCSPLYNDDPYLLQLADNGGPTLTHALQSGSLIAIDKIPSESFTTSPINGIDQRGAARNFNGDGAPSSNEGDIGAFEFRVPVTECTLPIGSEITFGNITLEFRDLGNLTCVTVEEMGPGVNHLLATSASTSGEAIQTNNWWHISGNGSGYNVALTLPYSQTDFTSRVCRWPGDRGGYGWDCGDGSDTTDSDTSVTRSDITNFSDWAIGDHVGPTAISLSSQKVKPVWKFSLSILGLIAILVGSFLLLRNKKFYN